MERVAVAGVGMTRFGKHMDTGLKALGREAVVAALADAAVEKDAVEAAFADAAHHITETYVQQRLIPAPMEPRGVAAVPEDVLDKIVAKIPVGRLGQANEIARGVAFLCSEDGGFVTGSTMSINGGQHMY